MWENLSKFPYTWMDKILIVLYMVWINFIISWFTLSFYLKTIITTHETITNISNKW